MHDGEEASLLAACYTNCLKLAVENDLTTVAFPSISTGAYGYPKDEAARVAFDTINKFLETSASIVEVRLVFFSQRDLETYIEALGIQD
jgi:O-acetyl-ADP-ribose deacetylase (regulator of RNase III)